MKLICWKNGAIKNIVVGKTSNFEGLVETKHVLFTEAKVRKWWDQRDVEWCDTQMEEGAGV